MESTVIFNTLTGRLPDFASMSVAGKPLLESLFSTYDFAAGDWSA